MCLHFCVHLFCAASCVINDDDDDDSSVLYWPEVKVEHCSTKNLV